MKNEKFSEHTANLALATAPVIATKGWTVGRNFFKPANSMQIVTKKDFMNRLQSSKK